MSSYWIASLASIILSVAVGYYTETWHAGILLFLITQPLFVGAFIYRDATRGLAGNNYGMCKGMTTREELGPALTPWLNAQIQEAAGLPLTEPLTFGHLWTALGGPPASGSAPVRSIDLEMFTTNLTHGRPYMLPHVEQTARLFYRHEELAAYLPTDVMSWFDEHALTYVPDPHSDPPAAMALALGLKEIPKPEHFPVLLAARMSLSFPVLFAAVPLWAIDYQHPAGKRTFNRCLFSDGGISSNFPMHLFDGLVPQWPTFGIDLEPAVPDLDQPIFLPKSYLGGVADRWDRFDGLPKSASRMGGFLMSIAGAMQNWNDNTQARSAGVRDRIVRVRLEPNEGGMNLNMPAGVIDSVAKKGGQAADAIIARFLGPPNPGPPSPGESNGHMNSWDGWSSQRWDRLDVLLYSLSQKAAGLQKSLGVLPHANSYAQLMQMSTQSAPPGHDTALTSDQVAALSRLTAALNEVADAFQNSAKGYPNNPQPEPELRARSVL
jgi:predicted acylesterase/phospholipase RssA